MFYFDRIDLSEGIDPAKSNNRKECMVCHYWVFNHGFKFQNYVCNGCNNLTMLCFNIGELLLQFLKALNIIVLFMILANVKPLGF